MSEPTDPRSALARVTLTSAQFRQFYKAVADHPGSVRIERLADGLVRMVLIGQEGDPISETLLPPV
jgi:hypothetical protein